MVTFRLVTGDTSTLYSDVLEREIEFAVCRRIGRMPEQLTGEAILHDSLAVRPIRLRAGESSRSANLWTSRGRFFRPTASLEWSWPMQLPVVLNNSPTPVGIITLKNRTLTPPAQLMIEHVRTLAKGVVRPWR